MVKILRLNKKLGLYFSTEVEYKRQAALNPTFLGEILHPLRFAVKMIATDQPNHIISIHDITPDSILHDH